MGDFNINYEQYIRTYNRNGYTHWRDMFFKQIENLRLIDTVSLYQDITPTTPFSTYIPKNIQISPSRIDFIWISRDLIDETLNSNIIDPTLYTSDHRAVFLSLHTRNLFKRKAIASLKQHDMRKRIYHYDQMNDDKWQEFADLVDAKHDLLDLSNMNITHLTGLNRYWDSIELCIQQAVRKTIPNHKTSVQHKEQHPKYLQEIYYDIKHINRIFIQHSQKNWEKNRMKLFDSWSVISNQIQHLCDKHTYIAHLPDTLFTQQDAQQARTEIKQLKDIMTLKAKSLERKHMDEQIKKFTDKRC